MRSDPDLTAATGRRVLYVEDSPADLALVEEALRTAGIAVALERVGDGEAALERARAAPPDLMLVDLRLPRLDGIEVVTALRADPEPRVRRTPVVILSTSALPSDVGRAYDAGVNCFLDKPLGFEEFTRAIAAVMTLWLEVVTAPPQ
jgi:two-component system, chemotaxis family, response regulator Rcp1